MPVAIIQKSASKVAFAGEISDKKLFDVLTEASISGNTGVLKLKVLLKEYSFYFHKGIIIYSSNSKKNLDKTVLEIIKYSGFISRKKLIECENQKNNAMKTILEILIDEGFVSMLLYSKLISLAMRTNVINAMLETRGTYTFEIKNKINSVHGVKPIQILQLNSLDTLVSENRTAVKAVLDSLYSKIYQCSDVTYLKPAQSLIYSAITTELDFLKFFTTAVTDFANKKWGFPNFFIKDRFFNTLLIYTVRTFVAIGLIVFLYFSSMTMIFDLKNEELNGSDFYFFRDKLLESFQNFQTDKSPTIQKPAPNTKKTEQKKLKLKTGQK